MNKPRLFLLVLATLVSAGLLAQQYALPVSANHNIQTTLRFQHSGMCLTSYGSGNGGPAMQWTCGGADNVSIEDAGGGYHYIRFLHSGKCLTINGNAWWDGGALDQWDCLGQPNQKWTGQFANGVYELHGSQLNPNKCITVAGEAWWNGAAINQWQCVGHANQAISVGVVVQPPTPTPPPCHPSYRNGSDARGGCIRSDLGDYDCWNRGNPGGDGPNYASGPFRISGSDPYGLDGNDNDGLACENG